MGGTTQTSHMVRRFGSILHSNHMTTSTGRGNTKNLPEMCPTRQKLNFSWRCSFPVRDLSIECNETNHLIQSTKKWVNKVVVGERLCPFAAPLVQSNTLRIVASSSQNGMQAIADVKSELDILLQPSSDAKSGQNHAAQLPQHESTLIVFDGPFVNDFRQFVRLSWSFQTDSVVSGGYVDVVQLVLFHPTASRQTYGSDDAETAADYTIRSPFPTIHLLREVDVMRVVTGSYPNLEELPSRNQRRFLAQGIEVCQTRLADCYEERE